MFFGNSNLFLLKIYGKQLILDIRNIMMKELPHNLISNSFYVMSSLILDFMDETHGIYNLCKFLEVEEAMFNL